MRKTRDDAEQTRAALLAAGITVFREKGFAAATISDIVSAANVTRGAFYHYFDTKAELFAALFLASGERGQSLVTDAIAKGGHPFDVLARVFVAQLADLEQDPNRHALAEFALQNLNAHPELTDVRAQVQLGRQSAFDNLVKTFTEGHEQQIVRSDIRPEAMALFFFALQTGLFQLSLLMHLPDSLTACAETLSKLMTEALKPQAK
jgi:TetR/AcrR family transcriptional regulator, acrAB operon repressor